MTYATKSSKTLSVTAYRGDAKTLLAFDILDKKALANLAGFTIQCQPDGQPAYYLQNTLQFETPGDHTQDAQEPANSSINAPLHKFRWLHVPGSVHQGVKPFYGTYTYRVTPRYFDAQQSLRPIDPALTVAIDVEVAPFAKGALALGFTRGFTQSQAFVHHFGRDALIRPKSKELLFDTNAVSGTNASGQQFTFADEYEWLGFTAQQQIAAIFDEVMNDKSLRLDVFAYDLNAPAAVEPMLALAKQGRIRVILDNAALHHDDKEPKPEDEFTTLFTKAAKKGAAIKRGHMSRYEHDKIFIVSNADGAVKVLTGSTNFSVTGLYVNSNHVLVFDDPTVAAQYATLFDAVWNDDVKAAPFVASDLSTKTFAFGSKSVPKMEITFAPHSKQVATDILDGIADRIAQEGKQKAGSGSVLFAVMELDNGTSPVYTALNDVHKDQKIFSYGISDNPAGIALYARGSNCGVLVTGKPVNTILPPPFDQVRGIGAGHQVHHKFVVCGFNRADAVVYCGSSNLAVGGEQQNGDNLLAIYDTDVATVFAIEALGLVDHFEFLDRLASPDGKKPKGAKPSKPPASKKQAAASAGWFLSTNDEWATPYYDKNDLRYMDRVLFAR